MSKLLLVSCFAALGYLGWPASADVDKDTDAPGVDLELIKALEGTWVAADEDGRPTDKVVSVYRVTAGGSAVVETVFPGSPEEMLTVYHMDGERLVLTHYCMMKNQPRMRATADSTTAKIVFKAFEVINAKSDADPAMRQGTVWIESADKLKTEWLMTENGETTYNATFTLLRKKN